MNVSIQTAEASSTTKPKMRLGRIAVFLVIAMLASFVQIFCCWKLEKIHWQLFRLKTESLAIQSKKDVDSAEQKSLYLYLFNGDTQMVRMAESFDIIDGPWTSAELDKQMKLASQAHKRWHSEIVDKIVERRRALDSKPKASISELQNCLAVRDPEDLAGQTSYALFFADRIVDNEVVGLERSRWRLWSISLFGTGIGTIFLMAALLSVASSYRAELRSRA